MKIWELNIEDMTHLGGPMGSEYTVPHFMQFTTEDKAKAFAEKHYNEATKGEATFTWRDHTHRKWQPAKGKAIDKTKRGRGGKWVDVKDGIFSGDLGFVMYTIREKEID